jgi:uncharacterized protein YggE
MKPIILSLSLIFLSSLPSLAQSPEVKFIADTLVVQAEGQYQADPDLATLSFHISTQEKELRRAYDTAAQSMKKIVDLADRNGLRKEDISTGALTVFPRYEGDRKQRARSYRVTGEIVLRVRDFSRIGSLIDDSVQDGIADFRSLTYSLADEEAAKEKAVAQAMHRAISRASVALEQKGQKLGALRYASLDVKQLVGVAQIQTLPLPDIRPGLTTFDQLGAAKQAAITYPTTQPEKITVAASVQCAFQIQ